MDDQRIIGERLAHLRTSRGETLESVAECVGISYVSMSRYENGKRMPKMDILARIADHFSVSLDSITGRSFPPEMRKAITSDLPLPQFPDLGDAETKPAEAGPLDDRFKSRAALLTPQNLAKLDAYLDGLLAAQDTKSP